MRSRQPAFRQNGLPSLCRIGWSVYALVGVSSVAHAVFSWGFAAPWIAPDEPTYALLGRSFWETGKLTILGLSAPFYSLLYPVFVGLPLTLLGPDNGVHAIKIVQAIVMSTTGFVVYAWARRVASHRLALLATALALAIPALAYSGLIMTEALYYPIATLALLMIARALEQPSLERQAIAVMLILLAALTRLQGLMLLPVLVTAVLTVAIFERSTRLLRRFAPALALLCLGAAIAAGVGYVGASTDVLGAYATTARSSYQLGPMLHWVVWHAADVFLLVAGLPLLAALALIVDAARGRESSPPARALLAVVIASTVWLVAQVGVFASRFADVLIERNLVTVAPPLFIALALWLERGTPRPQPWTAAVSVLTIAPALALPAGRLSDRQSEPNTFTPLVFHHLRNSTSLGWTRLVWLIAVASVVLLFLRLPRRAMLALAGIVLALLVGASVLASVDVHRLSHGLRQQMFGTAGARWIDQAASGRVTYLYDRTQSWNGVWIHAFWNTQIDRIATLPDEQLPGPLPPHETVSPRFDGRLFTTSGTSVDDPYVLASTRFAFIGVPIASIAAANQSRLTLWKVKPPTRLRMLRTGFQPNGDFSGHAEIDVFSCEPGQLEVTVLGKDASVATLGTTGVKPRTLAPGPQIGVHVVIPAPPTANGSTRCTFTFDTRGLVGTTVVTYTPAT